MITCNICGGATTTITVKEQMIGLKESFLYYQCKNCGHAHLHEIPISMEKYYDITKYYSFKYDNGFFAKSKEYILGKVKKLLVGVNVKKSVIYSASLQSFLSVDGVNKHSAILDYGCGAGQFVDELRGLGFSKVEGFDPYLPSDKTHDGKAHITNDLKTLKTICWDIILLNHVFEHLEKPVEILESINKILCPKGKLLLRFPVIDSFAFEKYKENWVQFDAPRHLNLFTRKSIRLAIEKAGIYKIIETYDDSYHFQFTGSELYEHGRTLSPQNNSQLKRLLSLNTYRYHFLAKKLNRDHKGDQIVVTLEKI